VARAERGPVCLCQGKKNSAWRDNKKKKRGPAKGLGFMRPARPSCGGHNFLETGRRDKTAEFPGGARRSAGGGEAVGEGPGGGGDHKPWCGGTDPSATLRPFGVGASLFQRAGSAETFQLGGARKGGSEKSGPPSRRQGREGPVGTPRAHFRKNWWRLFLVAIRGSSGAGGSTAGRSVSVRGGLGPLRKSSLVFRRSLGRIWWAPLLAKNRGKMAGGPEPGSGGGQNRCKGKKRPRSGASGARFVAR